MTLKKKETEVSGLRGGILDLSIVAEDAGVEGRSLQV